MPMPRRQIPILIVAGSPPRSSRHSHVSTDARRGECRDGRRALPAARYWSRQPMLSHLAVSGAASRGALLECIQHLGTRATLSKQIDAERLLNMNLVHDVKSGSWGGAAVTPRGLLDTARSRGFSGLNSSSPQ